MSEVLASLIDAMAEKAARDYLTAQANAGNDPAPDRTNPAPLPDMNKAA